MMKKYLFLLLLAPLVLFAQSNSIINLNEYGLNWTLEKNSKYVISEIKKEKSDLNTLEIKIKFDDYSSLTITELRKPLTVPVYINTFKKNLASKHSEVKLKAIVISGNAILFERDYISSDDDRPTIYKCMYGIIYKGKHYLVESDECETVEKCQELLTMAKSIKTV